MRMRRKHKGKEEVEVPVSSFSDVAFLLIIFFILATSLAKRTGFTTDAPAGEKGVPEAKKSNTIQLHDRKILFNEKPLNLEDLRRTLAELKLKEQEGEGRVVLLESSGDVPYQRYYEVMSAIASAGGVVAVVTEEDDDGGGT
ncbi:MAG: biopolymer transporter ExbD [Planctomycetota bacterium]|nr:biopolymer transporter ExbD [Planctomycetota bacterium]